MPTEATRISRLPPPQQPEVEHPLPALAPLAHQRALPWPQRLWQQAALRKTVILLVLVAAWAPAARLTDNELRLPTALATVRASGHIPASGELLDKPALSISLQLRGHVLSVVLALALTPWRSPRSWGALRCPPSPRCSICCRPSPCCRWRCAPSITAAPSAA